MYYNRATINTPHSTADKPFAFFLYKNVNAHHCGFTTEPPCLISVARKSMFSLHGLEAVDSFVLDVSTSLHCQQQKKGLNSGCFFFTVNDICPVENTKSCQFDPQCIEYARQRHDAVL